MKNKKLLSSVFAFAGLFSMVCGLTACNFVKDPTPSPENEVFTKIVFEDETVVYDGQGHTITVSGEPEGTTVTYTNAGPHTEIGSYEIGAKLEKNGYTTLNLTATLTIEGYEPLSINLPEGRALKVLQFADLHFGEPSKAYHNNKEQRTIEYMEEAVAEAKPDLIVCSGDNVMSTGVKKLTPFIELMDSLKTPWTFVYGNHDAENHAKGYSKAEISKALAASDSQYLLYEEGYIEEGTQNRFGNFSIQIKDSKGEKLVGAIVIMDSGTHDGTGYQAITEGQITWYENHIAELQATYSKQTSNKHTVIPSINFSHIQLPEFATGFDLAKANDPRASFIIEDKLGLNGETISSGGPKTNSGLFEVLKTVGSSKGYFVGHEHNFRHQVKLDNIILGFGPQGGFARSYDDNDLARGSYLYSVDENFAITTTEIKEDCSDIGLEYSGTYEGSAKKDADTGLYTVKVDFVLWNRIAFSYQGQRINLDDITVTGDYVRGAAPWNEKLYSEDGKKMIYSGSTARSYVLTYDEEKQILNVEAEKDEPLETLTEITPNRVNSDAAADAIAVWTNPGTKMKSLGAWDQNSIGNGWRYYIVVDSEGRLAYAVVNPPNGYGGPTGKGYARNSYYSDYTTNPTFVIGDGFGPWVQGGTAHEQFEIVIPEGGFAITSHGTGNGYLVNLLSKNTVTDLSDGNLNRANTYSDDLRIHFDTSTNKITVSGI